MTKVIHKQSNKVVLALLALGSVVHASTHRGYVPTFCCHRRLAISEAFTPIVPGNTGQNGDSAHYPSLPGSSGDIPIAEPTRVQTNTTLTVINPLNGTRLLRSTKLHYSEVIAKIRAQLGQGLIIKLTQDGQVIPQNTPDKLEGEIGYTVQGSIISVIPSSCDELCRGLQELIHGDFFNLSLPRVGMQQFCHINATRVVESAPLG
jgi:hypothetical protein